MAPTATDAQDAPTPEAEARKLNREQTAAVARLFRAFQGYGAARKTMASIARAVVSLRLTFEKDGQPDYRGDTAQYRLTVATIYEQVIPEPDERAAFKTAIRYWIGKEYAARVAKGDLRVEDLQAAGLMLPAQPRGRRESADAGDEAPSIPDGPLSVLVHVARQLAPVVDVLHDVNVMADIDAASLRETAALLLAQVMEVATIAGIDVPTYVDEWEPTAALTTH